MIKTDSKKLRPFKNSPDRSGIREKRWLQKTLATRIRTDSGTCLYDEGTNLSLQKENKLHFILEEDAEWSKIFKTKNSLHRKIRKLFLIENQIK